MTDAEMKMLLFWDNQHMDTCDIAQLIGSQETAVCSILWRLREERRRDRQRTSQNLPVGSL